MSRERTITVTLTEAQFRALTGAVDLAEQDWNDSGRSITALTNLYSRMHKAWAAAK